MTMKSIKGIAKKTGLLLMVVATLALSLPANIVQAVGATVEVNNGNTITLNVGANITATGTNTNGTGGIPVTVKGLPDLGAPANGMASFTFNFTWNKDVIRVDSIKQSVASQDETWAITRGAPDNVLGKVTATGLRTEYSTNDTILLYFGITAMGTAGTSTNITVGITTLGDKDGAPIAATSVNAPVEISWGTLNSIAVTPTAPSIALGQTQQFTATGNYTAGTANITGTANWTSSNPGVATIGLNTGLATSVAAGTTTITATSGTISGNTTLTVTAAQVVSIVVTPANPSIAAGLTKQFSANGTYTNATTANITTTANWTSSNPGVATIGLNTGLATGLAVGTTNITAT